MNYSGRKEAGGNRGDSERERERERDVVDRFVDTEDTGHGGTTASRGKCCCWGLFSASCPTIGT